MHSVNDQESDDDIENNDDDSYRQLNPNLLKKNATITREKPK